MKFINSVYKLKYKITIIMIMKTKAIANNEITNILFNSMHDKNKIISAKGVKMILV